MCSAGRQCRPRGVSWPAGPRAGGVAGCAGRTRNGLRRVFPTDAGGCPGAPGRHRAHTGGGLRRNHVERAAVAGDERVVAAADRFGDARAARHHLLRADCAHAPYRVDRRALAEPRLEALHVDAHAVHRHAGGIGGVRDVDRAELRGEIVRQGAADLVGGRRRPALLLEDIHLLRAFLHDELVLRDLLGYADRRHFDQECGVGGRGTHRGRRVGRAERVEPRGRRAARGERQRDASKRRAARETVCAMRHGLSPGLPFSSDSGWRSR